MKPTQTSGTEQSAGRWLFLSAFAFSCFLFWWLRSLLFRFVFRLPDSVEDTTIAISLGAFACFVFGYLIPRSHQRPQAFSDSFLDSCADFSYRVTLVWFFPALAVSVFLFLRNSALPYGAAGIPFFVQAILYTHLFFGFMFLGAVADDQQTARRMLIVVSLLALPRLIIALHGARFFLAQAIIPVLFIVLPRGILRLTAKRVALLAVLGAAILIVPAVTRGDTIFGPGNELQLFTGSDILGLFQNNLDLRYNPACPPLLLSLTAKTIPYGVLGVCVMDSAGLKNIPATLEHILTENDPATFHGTQAGTGSNYLLELYLTGGMFAVFFGSAAFGFTCRCFLGWLGARSLFSAIWAECLTRALLAPRGNLGYVYERIPSLIGTVFLVVIVVALGKILQKDFQETKFLSTGNNNVQIH